MASIANLVIADATPSNKTLYPMTSGMAASWFERAANSIVANRVAKLALSLAHPKRATDRITLQYASPKEALVDGTWTVTGTARATVEYTIPADWTDTDRNNFATEVKNLCGTSTVISTVRRDPAMG